jgi:hypothetical protein
VKDKNKRSDGGNHMFHYRKHKQTLNLETKANFAVILKYVPPFPDNFHPMNQSSRLLSLSFAWGLFVLLVIREMKDYSGWINLLEGSILLPK